MARTVYILGMSGFLGTHLQYHFQKAGDRVIGIHHTDTQLPTLESGAIVINCSARYIPDTDWPTILRGNYGFAQSVLSRCDSTHRLINFGSYFEYGEDGISGPINNYAIAKCLLRSWLEDQRRAGHLTAVSFILYDVIGPGDARPKLIPMLCRSLPGEEIALTACEQIIDLVPVERIIGHVEAWLATRRHPNADDNGLFSVSGGDPRPLIEIVELLREQRGFIPRYGSKPYAPTQIFRPVRNLPVLKMLPMMPLNTSYLNALCAEDFH